jgi:ERCC4-type nuclease
MPAPLVLLVDTREQRPLVFSDAVSVERATLAEGDYTAKGLEGRVAIERKSLADLVGSLTSGRERFLRELERLRPYMFRAIVVEGSMAEVVAGAYRSRATPASILGSVCALIADYSIPVIFADDAKTAAVIVEKLLGRLHRAHCTAPEAA